MPDNVIINLLRTYDFLKGPGTNIMIYKLEQINFKH